MLLMLQQWDSEELEIAMLLDEPPIYEYEPIPSGGEPWRAEGHLAKASRDIDLNGFAWLFVVYKSDPLKTWGQRKVKLTTGGEILREETHCGLWTGLYRSLRYEIIVRKVYGNIVGKDSDVRCAVIIDARIQHDPPDSEAISRPPTRDYENSQQDSSFDPCQNGDSHKTDSCRNETADGGTYTASPSSGRNQGRSRGGKTILPCRSDPELHSASEFKSDSPSQRAASHEAVVHANNVQGVPGGNLGYDEPSLHEALGHTEPQYRSRSDLYGEIQLVPKQKHGAVVSFLINGGHCRDDWYVEDGYSYSERFQFLITEFQRRPFVSEVLSRLGFVVGAAPNIKETLQPHLVKVMHSFEDMSKVTKHGRFR